MMKNEIEGYINPETKESKILFILKEPHTDNQREFWFRKVVDALGIGMIAGKKYFHTLGILAGYILDGSLVMSNDMKQQLLRQCAYMNIKPNSGDNRAGDSYNLFIKDPSNLKKREEYIRKINPDYIVCLGTYDVVVRKMEFDQYDDNSLNNKFSYQKSNIVKEFQNTCINIDGKAVPIYEFYHPAYAMSYEKIKFE